VKNENKIKAFLKEQHLFLLYYKETLITTSNKLNSQSNRVKNLLKEFNDIFPKELPSDLSPLRKIKHQIDLVPGAS